MGQILHFAVEWVQKERTMPRYTIDMGEDIDRLLSQLAATKGTTKSEIIRRALASYNYLITNAAPEQGKKVSITDQEDRVLKDVVLP
jgi:predicted transcriptional regulator